MGILVFLAAAVSGKAWIAKSMQRALFCREQMCCCAR